MPQRHTYIRNEANKQATGVIVPETSPLPARARETPDEDMATSAMIIGEMLAESWRLEAVS